MCPPSSLPSFELSHRSTLQATQTLGEEYTGMWLHSLEEDGPPSRNLRVALILLPTLPSYIAAKWSSALPQGSKLISVLRKVPPIIEIFAEINLAIFYLRGTFYHLTKRILSTRYVSRPVYLIVIILTCTPDFRCASESERTATFIFTTGNIARYSTLTSLGYVSALSPCRC